MNIHWKDWCWSWSSSTLATWLEELTRWKGPWCWERLRARGEEDDRGWDGWMASPTQWTWVWVNSGSWWWTGSPGVLRFMVSQRVGHAWVTELNWTSFLYVRKLVCSSRRYWTVEDNKILYHSNFHSPEYLVHCKTCMFSERKGEKLNSFIWKYGLRTAFAQALSLKNFREEGLWALTCFP